MIRFLMRGFDEVKGRFGDSAALEKMISDSQSNWARDVVRKELKGRDKYPPERPGQKYKRTGRLGDSWATRTAGPMMRAIYNPTPYAHWVVGDTHGNRQAWMHKGRWWIARQKVLSMLPSLVRRIELRVTHFFEGTGIAPGEGIREYAKGVVEETLKGPYAKP
jgi:hypothetical protein